MGKSKQAKDAGDRADAIIKEINNPNPPEPNPPEPTPPEPIPTPPEPTPPEPAPPEPTPTPPEPAPVDHKAQLEELIHKHETLMGKYNNELPRAYNEIGDLKVALAEAKSSIDELKRNQTPAPTAASVPEPKGLAYVRKEMPEMEEVIHYIVKTEVEKMVGDLVGKKVVETDSRLNSLETQTTENAAKTFYDALDKGLAHWKVINENPEFLKWLETPEPYSGATRMILLQDAYTKFDSTRVLRIFSDFVKEQETLKNPPTPSPTTPTPGKFEATPKPAGGGEPIPSVEGDFVTAAEITQFYNDVAVGRYKNREKERADMEAKINKAVSAGNVR